MEWFIGSTRNEPSAEDASGRRHSTVNLVIPIGEDEYDALVAAANSIRATLRGVLFRLVFSNAKAIRDVHDTAGAMLSSADSRNVDWDEVRVQFQLAFANWLSS